MALSYSHLHSPLTCLNFPLSVIDSNGYTTMPFDCSPYSHYPSKWSSSRKSDINSKSLLCWKFEPIHFDKYLFFGEIVLLKYQKSIENHPKNFSLSHHVRYARTKLSHLIIEIELAARESESLFDKTRFP